MRRAFGFLAISIFALGANVFAQTGPYSIEIDLQEQTAYLVRDGRAVLSTPISSGRYGHLTEDGSFRVIEKERNHFSNMYGRIVDRYGRTVVADADADMRVPRGCRFIPAPMRVFRPVRRREWSACGHSAGISSLAWLCARAGRECDRDF
jgi:hypothetical protein